MRIRSYKTRVRLQTWPPDPARAPVFYAAFMPSSSFPGRAFTAGPPIPRLSAQEADDMADILLVVLGAGGIILMAAYAELCDRI